MNVLERAASQFAWRNRRNYSQLIRVTGIVTGTQTGEFPNVK
jgi:hypothetical protein